LVTGPGEDPRLGFAAGRLRAEEPLDRVVEPLDRVVELAAPRRGRAVPPPRLPVAPFEVVVLLAIPHTVVGSSLQPQ
jgi:hypothetical protein